MYCNCHCHSRGQDGLPLAVHCFPCCSKCKYCGANIQYTYIKKHLEEHEKRFDELKQWANEVNTPLGSGRLPPI